MNSIIKLNFVIGKDFTCRLCNKTNTAKFMLQIALPCRFPPLTTGGILLSSIFFLSYQNSKQIYMNYVHLSTIMKNKEK